MIYSSTAQTSGPGMMGVQYPAVDNTEQAEVIHKTNEIVRRAALDVGSGEVKLIIADVNVRTNKIEGILFRGTQVVDLLKKCQADPDKALNKDIEDTLVKILKAFPISRLAPQQWSGIGTSVFRQASNSPAFLSSVKERTHVPIRVIPQTEEGEIGFRSAVATSGLPADQVIAWDSGSGSFQMTALNNDGHLETYGAEFAGVGVWKLLCESREQRFDPSRSPNPITLDEANRMIEIICKHKLPPVPDWLVGTGKKIIAIGGDTCIFSQGKTATGNKEEPYTLEELRAAIDRLAGSTDAQLSQFLEPKKALIGLILLYAVMQHCQINQVCYQKTNGNCEGLLVSPEYWETKQEHRETKQAQPEA